MIEHIEPRKKLEEMTFEELTALNNKTLELLEEKMDAYKEIQYIIEGLHKIRLELLKKNNWETRIPENDEEEKALIENIHRAEALQKKINNLVAERNDFYHQVELIRKEFHDLQEALAKKPLG